MGPYDCYSVAKCATIGPSDVSVKNSSGIRLAVYEDSSVGIITDGRLHLLGVVKFEVHKSGAYVITIHSSTSAVFVIAMPPVQEASALAGWIAGAIIGLLLTVISLVGALIARGRRRINF